MMYSMQKKKKKKKNTDRKVLGASQAFSLLIEAECCARQYQQNGMCANQWFRSGLASDQSDQSLRCALNG